MPPETLPGNTETILVNQATPKPVKKVLIEEALGWAKLALIAVALAFLLTRFIVVNAEIPSASMEPTIMTNDRIIAFRLSYLFSAPERFDIVIFHPPHTDERPYVKRIMGLPGDRIHIRNGYVFVNDSETPLRDDFAIGAYLRDYGPFFVPEGHFFMLGDNRSNSADSRIWRDPFVPQERFLGRAIFRYFRGFAML